MLSIRFYVAIDFLQETLDIVTLIKGRSCTIQGSDPGTLLHIPEGVYAALLGNIHIDYIKVNDINPSNDYRVAPICECYLQPFIGRILPSNKQYKIQVSYIVENVDNTQRSIRIKHADIHSGLVLPVHKLEEKFVDTSNFSGYIVTDEGINCCSKKVNVLLFGSLMNNPEIGAWVAVKVYLSKILSQPNDYAVRKIRPFR